MDRVVFVVVVACALRPIGALGEAFDGSPQDKSPQQSVSAATSSPVTHSIVPADSIDADHIQLVLKGKLRNAGLDCTDTPLAQIVNSLQDEYGIPILLDVPALKDAGLNPEEPFSINLRNISLKSALRLMLRQHQLTYIICNDVLLITTPEQAEANLTTRVYDVRDIIGGGDDAEAAKSLIDVIVSCVATESWAVNGGGQAQIRPLKPGMLVVSQTQAVQEQVLELFEAIRQISHEKPVTTK